MTGASSGIGLAIARMLGEEGYGLTVASRRPEKLEAAAEQLAGAGYDVQQVAGDMGSEEVIKRVVEAHRERFGRLDVLVNNAGVGIGAAVDEIQTKYLDMQLAVNLRSMILFYRECARAAEGRGRRAPQRAGREHLIDRRQVRPGVAVGLLGRQARRRRLHPGDEQGAERRRDQVLRPLPRVRRHRDDRLRQGLCPGRGDDPPEDVAEAVRLLLRVSPACVIPEVVFQRPGETL